MAKSTIYYVYVLIKNEKPIYVGRTQDLAGRIYQHKLLKDFDSHMVFYEGRNYIKATGIEKGMIMALSWVCSDSLQNIQSTNAISNP